MREGATQYIYQGITFGSKEAMELFIASRAPSNPANSKPRRQGKGQSPIGPVFIVGAVIFTLAVGFGGKTPSTAQPTSNLAPGAVTPSEASSNMAALLINTSGELCARVTSITHLQGDTYTVACVRYRDGTGTATYEMNAATGAVK